MQLSRTFLCHSHHVGIVQDVDLIRVRALPQPVKAIAVFAVNMQELVVKLDAHL